MNKHTATEVAYKNGYEQGRAVTAREIFEEIEKITFSFGYGVRSDHSVAKTRSIDDDFLAELKNKYTGGSDKHD